MKKLSIAVVDDDLFVLESIGRLMQSLGYTTEAFPSAADFLASPHLDELLISTEEAHTGILVAVRDSGPGRSMVRSSRSAGRFSFCSQFS
jgi:CheY-like chemotaxis protein